jgi:hypothetical protein
LDILNISMAEASIPPNGRVLLDALMITPEMMRSLPKVPVPVRALRALLSILVATLPFDEEFYATTYPDLAKARDAGSIADLRMHFLEHGYLEGRLGAKPQVDEDFYRETYPDVAKAIASRKMRSALEHYVTAGASEGRVANPGDLQARRVWLDILGQ